MSLIFVLGGARSGKTRYALAQADQAARESGGRRVLLATAEALDAEMAARIARHRAERGPEWTTLEIPLALPQAIAGLQPRDVAVVDCLTLWLSNLMHAQADIGEETQALVAALHASPADAVILVSNEVGQGIVPDNALARRFRDEAGWMHQAVAGAVDRMVVVQAGLPQILKG